MTVPLDKLILGANPFEGVSYQSRTLSVQYQELFAKEDNVAAVFDAAYNSGVRAITCSNTPNVIGALNKFPKTREMKIYPVIPNAYEYAMEASEKGVLGAVLSKAKGFTLYQKVRLGVRALTKIKSVLTKDVMDLLLELLDFEMQSFAKFNIGGVFLHGQLTDMALSSHNPDILAIFADVIRDQFKAEPMLATHNFGDPPAPAHGVGDQAPDHGPLQRQGLHDEAVPGRVREPHGDLGLPDHGQEGPGRRPPEPGAGLPLPPGQEGRFRGRRDRVRSRGLPHLHGRQEHPGQ